MVLVVPNVARYTVHGTIAGRDTATILDFTVEDAPIGTRTSALPALAGRILHVWTLFFIGQQTNDWVGNSVSWVDLDSVGGTTGQVTSGETTTWPATGGQTGDPMPNNVAVLIRKNTTSARNERSGRSYIPGVPEGYTLAANPNRMEGLTLSNWQADADDFLDGVNSGETGYDATLVVVHAPPPPPDPATVVQGTSTDVSSLTVDALLATQRRRLRP